MNALAVRTEILQLVTFTLGGGEYATDILKVQEINRMVTITVVPNTPGYVEGVINLRGKVIPVINLRKKVSLDTKAADAQSRAMAVEMWALPQGCLAIPYQKS